MNYLPAIKYIMDDVTQNICSVLISICFGSAALLGL